MLNIVMRVIGLSMIALALVILGVDLFAMVEKGGAFNAHSLGQDWKLYSKGTYVGFASWLEHALPVNLAGDVELGFGLWTWAAIALAGILVTPFRKVP